MDSITCHQTIAPTAFLEQLRCLALSSLLPGKALHVEGCPFVSGPGRNFWRLPQGKGSPQVPQSEGLLPKSLPLRWTRNKASDLSLLDIGLDIRGFEMATMPLPRGHRFKASAQGKCAKAADSCWIIYRTSSWPREQAPRGQYLGHFVGSESEKQSLGIPGNQGSRRREKVLPMPPHRSVAARPAFWLRVSLLKLHQLSKLFFPCLGYYYLYIFPSSDSIIFSGWFSVKHAAGGLV